MSEDLYLTRAKRYVESDPSRGIEHSSIDSSGEYLIPASSPNDATEQLLAYLKSNTRYRNWESDRVRKLIVGADIPLEKRLEILGEIFDRLPQ